MQNEFANVDKHQLHTSTKEKEINRPSFSIGGYDVRFSKTKQSCGCVETSVTGMAIAFLLLLEKGKKKFFSTFHSVHLFKRNCRRLWSLAKTVKPPNPSWEKEKKTSLAGIEFDAPRCFHFPLRVFSFVRSTWWTIEREKRRGGGRPAVVEIFFICCVCVHLRNGIFQLEHDEIVASFPFFFFSDELKKKKHGSGIES